MLLPKVILMCACCLSGAAVRGQSALLKGNATAKVPSEASGLTIAAADASRVRSAHEQEDRVVQKIRAQIAKDGDSAEAESQLAIALYRDQQPAQSLDSFSSLLKFRQPNADELRFIALDYVALGDLVNADKWLHESLKLRSDDWRTWRYLGGVQYSEEMVAEAGKSFTQCLTLDPKNALAEDGLARSLDAQGKHDQAVSAYVLAVALNLQQSQPSVFPPLHYGSLLFRDGNLNEALTQLLSAAKLDPKDSETHEMLSNVYRRMGNIKEALKQMRLASSLDPERARLHFLIAQLYRDVGNKVEAQKEIERYVEVSKQHPNDPDR